MTLVMPCIDPTCRCTHEITCADCGSNKVNLVDKVGPVFYIHCDDCKYNDAIFHENDMKGLSETEFLKKYPSNIPNFFSDDSITSGESSP
jgi:hypothetical protein